MVPDRVARLVEFTAPLAERFGAAGHRLYLVGGSVRDLFLDRVGEERDLDFTTDARPETTERILRELADAVWLQGKAWGTIGARWRGRQLEVTTHRAEAYRPESRKPEVVFGDDVTVDLSRRDFTVNAMALRLPVAPDEEPELLDPYGGLADLAARRLRTPLAPEESFGDDPLRMLRAARFLAGLRLEPDPALVAAVRAMAARLAIVSVERVRDELNELLVLPKPSPGLAFLVGTGLAEQFLPELPALALEQDPIHRHKDVLAHTLAVVDKTSPDLLLRLAALLHDIGKPRTRAYGPDGVSFHHHDVVGARMARERLVALRYSAEDVEVVSRLVELHLRFHTYRLGWTDRAVRRYVRDAGPLLERLNELTRCDCTTRNAAKARALARRMDELEQRIAELRAREELDAIRPDLDGRQVMAHLGIPPGPLVGEALAFLLDLRLDEGPLGEEEARRRLDAWWAARRAADDAGEAARLVSPPASEDRDRQRRTPPPGPGPRRRGTAPAATS
ncbi:CCA tRNA nucleotidyltransferase [Aciditerrimonas ferrireducens]|uniref:CCA tRNA nucleotidyltransferase n=1 Tax=Aciditerrimonas ferrireducens TaxID=667306 RepID=UPI0028A17F41|nr:CCA tRNA nucleotidyltransferase [Aciditerrimonas ferrireducens]